MRTPREWQKRWPLRLSPTSCHLEPLRAGNPPPIGGTADLVGSAPTGAGAGAPTVRRSFFDLSYGNITTWGEKARAYLGRTSADLVMFVETHLDEQALSGAQVRSCIQGAGFKFVASAASPTGRGGTHGGTMICVRRHIECKFFDQQGPHQDFSAAGLRLRGLNLVAITLYLDDQKDHSCLSKENVAKLNNVLIFVKALGSLASLRVISIAPRRP